MERREIGRKSFRFCALCTFGIGITILVFQIFAKQLFKIEKFIICFKAFKQSLLMQKFNIRIVMPSIPQEFVLILVKIFTIS